MNQQERNRAKDSSDMARMYESQQEARNVSAYVDAQERAMFERY